MAKELKQKEDPSEVEILQKQVVELQAQFMFLESKVTRPDSGNVDRLNNIEDAAENQFPDAPFAEVADRPGEPPDIKVQTNPDNGLSEGEMLPIEIEWGIPTADITADSDTVTLQPCDEEGTEFADADTIDVYVCDDRSEQALVGKGWIATVPEVPEDPGPPVVPAVPAVPGTILSFMRLPVFGPDADGVLVGEARQKAVFPARLLREKTGDGNGEYDQWEEVEPSDTAPNTWQAGGASRTHTSTGESLWESNRTPFIPTDSTVDDEGSIVWVHLEIGVETNGETRYVFDWQRIPFPIRLETEGSDGEYTGWFEVVVDADPAEAGDWATFSGGSKITATTTGKSAWEANKHTGIHAHATTGTVVWAHFEYGDEVRVVFDYQTPGDFFPARLKQEDSNHGGEYDQWEEVETDNATAGAWQTKAGGRTHTSTGLSLWEANLTADIPSHGSNGEIVWVVPEQTGDEQRLVFFRQNTPFPIRLVTTSQTGEYEQWKEVETDTATAGAWQDRGDGAERTHATTGLSAWEANKTTLISADSTTGTVVWGHIEIGDEVRVVFDYQGVEGGDAPATPPDKDKGWIYFRDRDGVTEIAHAIQRDEVVHTQDGGCPAIYAFDETGHCIGWWIFWSQAWESPWGFDDPGWPG